VQGALGKHLQHEIAADEAGTAGDQQGIHGIRGLQLCSRGP
jgi:hypothetical protein